MRCPGFVSPAGCGTKEGTKIFLFSRRCVNQLLIEGCVVAGVIWDLGSRAAVNTRARRDVHTLLKMRLESDLEGSSALFDEDIIGTT